MYIYMWSTTWNLCFRDIQTEDVPPNPPPSSISYLTSTSLVWYILHPSFKDDDDDDDDDDDEREREREREREGER